MSIVALELDATVLDLLRHQDQPIERRALELIVIELFRRGEISRGKAAELLDMALADFIDLTAELNIPYFELSAEELDLEIAAVDRLA